MSADEVNRFRAIVGVRWQRGRGDQVRIRGRDGAAVEMVVRQEPIFQDVQGSSRVHTKIYVWVARGPVVGRLCGGMNDCRDAALMLRKNILDRRSILDIDITMVVVLEIIDEPIPRFSR